MKRLLLLLLVSTVSCFAQDQTVTLNISQTIIIHGLTPGCVATMSGTIINITGCPIPPPPVTVKIACPSTSILVGQSVQCGAQVSNASNTAVTWASGNNAVASVDQNGLVKGVGVGTVNILATSQADTTKSDSLSFTITQITADVVVQAETTTVSNGAISTSPTQDTGGGNKINLKVLSQTYDYTINVPAAATYYLNARLNIDAGATGALTVHFEYPIGTDVTGPISIGPGPWTTLTASKTFALPAGSVVMRMKVDTLPTGSVPVGYINWFEITTVPAKAPSVALSWTPGPVSLTACPPVTCPIPANTPPCYSAPESFRVYRSQTSGNYTATPVTVPYPQSTFTDISAQPGQTLFYKVTAYNSNSCTPESAASNEVKVTIPATKSSTSKAPKKVNKKKGTGHVWPKV